MKVIMYVVGGAISYFPTFSEFEKQGVTVRAERAGLQSVRWTLAGSSEILWQYVRIARKLNLRYQIH